MPTGRGYGVAARRVSDRAGLEEALREGLAGDAPLLIGVQTREHEPLRVIPRGQLPCRSAMPIRLSTMLSTTCTTL